MSHNTAYVLTILIVLGFLFGMARTGAVEAPTAGAGVFFAEGDHCTVWEDGSYIINTLNGEKITGCIEGGLCND